MSLPLQRITDLLSRKLGLSGQSLGGKAIDSAIHRRMSAIELDSLSEYADRLERDGKEQDELTEAVVVPETWFYRYPESFRHLGESCKSRPYSEKPIRILSAPCATGEECYSIAMALLEVGLPMSRFQIEGLDVSRRAIQLAEQGHYSERAFREPQVPPREKYFHQQKADYHVRSELRERIHFRTANMADPNLLIGEQPFDAIFCRNLFIYLTDEARKRVINALDRLLAPQGVVYMGHAEPLTIMDSRFRSLSPPQAFAFARSISTTPVEASPVKVAEFGQETEASNRKPLEPVPPSPTSGSYFFPIVQPNTPLPKPSAQESALLLDQAKQAVNAAELEQAATLCEQHLREAGPSAETFALLGTVRVMLADLASAERNFTRALYLEPTHYEALLQMLMLAERRGDQVTATNYRRRLANLDRRRTDG